MRNLHSAHSPSGRIFVQCIFCCFFYLFVHSLYSIEGTVYKITDFSFFMNHLPPGPLMIPVAPLKIFQKFSKLFATQGAHSCTRCYIIFQDFHWSLASSTPVVNNDQHYWLGTKPIVLFFTAWRLAQAAWCWKRYRILPVLFPTLWNLEMRSRGEGTRVGNLSPAMGRGIDSRNRVWNWVAKLHGLAARYENPMSTWFLTPIAGHNLPSQLAALAAASRTTAACCMMRYWMLRSSSKGLRLTWIQGRCRRNLLCSANRTSQLSLEEVHKLLYTGCSTGGRTNAQSGLANWTQMDWVTRWIEIFLSV